MKMAFSSLGTEVTAFSLMADRDVFPFITMPLFEANAQHAREQSGAEIIALEPIVYMQQRNDWEVYSNEHQDWIQYSRDLIVEMDEHYNSSTFFDEPITPYIHYHDDNGEDIKSATAQVSLTLDQLSSDCANHGRTNV